ncbi:MAG: VOC family protein [Planctomycetes bacterium]|nr:VOC family protein [Planctomycetota bacterium]
MSEQTPPSVGAFCWNELMTHEPGKSREFYGSLFGWEFKDENMGEFTYTIIRKGETHVGGMMGMSGPDFEGVPNHWVSYVLVEDVHVAASKIQELGGHVIHGPAQVPNVGEFVVFADPSGAVVAAWKSLQQAESC